MRLIPLASLALLFAQLAALPAELTLTAPRDYQVVQRATPTKGTVRLVSQLSDDATGDAVVETRLVGEKSDGAWRRLEAKVSGRALSGTFEASAGGWWRLEVRVSHAGKVFVVAGQSNSANHGEEKQVPQKGRVAAFDGKGWRLA